MTDSRSNLPECVINRNANENASILSLEIVESASVVKVLIFTFIEIDIDEIIQGEPVSDSDIIN